MSLTERERRCLEDLALEISHEDPALARMLTRGRWLPRRARMRLSVLSFLTSRRWWQWCLALMTIGGLVVFLVAGVPPSPVTDTVGAAIMLTGAAVLCVVRLVAGHRRRRNPV